MTTYTLDYNPDTDCIELTVYGVFDMQRLRSIAPEVAALSERYGCSRILNDMSAARISVSVMDAYNSPQEIDKAGIGRSTRRALVAPADFEQAGFLETVTRNRGHNFRVFSDREQALEWLQTPQGTIHSSLNAAN